MKKPSLVSAITEPFRASGEFVTSVGLLAFRSRLPVGEPHPVLVLPGFMATDRSTAPLRRLLSSLGHEPYGWGLGRNVGPTERVVREMPQLLDRIADDTNGPVSIIGWSLGGIYARQLAARTAEQVRVVVTLGTPVRQEVRKASNAQGLFDRLSAFHTPGHPLLDDGEPLSVPVTAVHTRADGVVHWETCLVHNAPNAENLRVTGSHTGLGFNPAVAYIIADRLAQPVGAWSPFEAPAPYQRIISHVDRLETST